MLLGQRQRGSAVVKASGRSLAPLSQGRAEGCRTRPSWPHGGQVKERAGTLGLLFGKVLASCVMLQKFPGGCDSWGGYWKWDSSGRDLSLSFEGKILGWKGGGLCVW